MKFPYKVKYNGVVYPANTEIPESKKETPKKETKKKADK